MTIITVKQSVTTFWVTLSTIFLRISKTADRLADLIISLSTLGSNCPMGSMGQIHSPCLRMRTSVFPLGIKPAAGGVKVGR